MSARDVALRVVRDVFPQRGTGRGAQQSLDYRLRQAGLDSRDRAFATELAYGAIKMRRALDWYLQPYVGDRRTELPATTMEILRLAAYELRYTDADEHATVNEFVGLANRYGHRGLASLANAVLRTMLRETPLEPTPDAFGDHDDYLGTKYSLPTWLVRQWRVTFGTARAESICKAVNGPAQAAISVDRSAAEPAEVASALQKGGVTVRRSPYVPETLLLEAGADVVRRTASQRRWWPQSESSAIAVEVLQPQSGERVLDACSGRGNKALQIALRMGIEGGLTCVDRNAEKLRELERRFDEHGVAATTIMADATQLDRLHLPQFDRALIDAPCSGTGVIGRHPEARWKKRSTDGERLAATQRALLDAVAQTLYPGGAMVYAVCSVDPREGIDVVDSFLAHNNFTRGLVPSGLRPFLTEDGDVLIAPGIEGRDGFFISRLEIAA